MTSIQREVLNLQVSQLVEQTNASLVPTGHRWQK